MELQILKSEKLLGREIKIYGTNENPLFLAKDIAEWIEYSKSGNGSYNLSQMLSTVDDDEKQISLMLVGGQKREILTLTEDGMFEVLMQSRKPIAKEFKKGVKHILKEVRIKGGYIATNVDDTPEMIMAKGLQVAMQTIQTFKMQNKQLEQQNEIQKEQLQIAEPLAQLAKDCYISTETMKASTISARLGFKSPQHFNKTLKEMGIQHKINSDECWVLNAKYSAKGYTKTVPFPYPKSDGSVGTRNSMEWTESGFVFLREFINKKLSA